MPKMGLEKHGSELGIDTLLDGVSVTIFAYGGVQFELTAAEARQLADELIAAADRIDTYYRRR